MIENDEDDPNGEIFEVEVFEPIYKYLSEIYGPPQEVENEVGKRVKYKWKFESNVIKINFAKDPKPSGDAWIMSIFISPLE